MIKRISTETNPESGNVFMFILLGIVLFAALSYTMSRGFRSEGTSKLSDQQSSLGASEIMNFGAQVARAVDRLRRKNISETDISFESSVLSRHNVATVPWAANPNCSSSDCKIFDVSGGSIKEQIFEQYSYPHTTPYSTSHPKEGHPAFYRISVQGIGTDAEDLVMIIVRVQADVCNKINSKLGIADVDTQTSETWLSFGITARSSTIGYWAFSNTESSEPLFDEYTALQGAEQGCYNQSTYGYSYFKVLIAR